MNVKIFNLPLPSSQGAEDELNQFLRSHKVLQLDSEIVTSSGVPYWCFCVRYLPQAPSARKAKIDYREVLDETTFQCFSKLRAIRKAVAQEDGVPAYAVFTDAELADIAKLPQITAEALKSIPGIGEKKLQRYGDFFIGKSDSTGGAGTS